LSLLEIGAGHGDYTVEALAAGCSVTATDMSRDSVAFMKERFQTNPVFRAVFDQNGMLDGLGDARFSVILCSSVLHHIPDYSGFIKGPVLDRLERAGTLLIFQEPLWYPRLRRSDYWASRAAYLAWRSTRGSYLRGLSTLGRRIVGRLDASTEADMVEYHVVRQGVDESAIADECRDRFDHVECSPYWSTQAPPFQWIGQQLGLRNTFLIKASDFH